MSGVRSLGTGRESGDGRAEEEQLLPDTGMVDGVNDAVEAEAGDGGQVDKEAAGVPQDPVLAEALGAVEAGDGEAAARLRGVADEEGARILALQGLADLVGLELKVEPPLREGLAHAVDGLHDAV